MSRGGAGIDSRISERMKNTLPFLAIMLIAVLFFLPFFTRGYVLDGNSDRRDINTPFELISLRSFQLHEIPQWNPYIFCGNSFFGAAANYFFYPPNWIAYSFSEDRLAFIHTILSFVHFVFAGLTALLFFRRYLEDRFWSLIAAVTYLLSTPLIMNMTAGMNAYSGFFYLPLWLYLIISADERGPLAGFLLQTLTAALMIIGGNLNNTVYFMGICVAFSFYHAIAERRGDRKTAARLIFVTLGSVALALLISAIRLIPFYLSLQLSSPDTTPYADMSLYARIDPKDLLRYFVPEFFGASLKGPYFGHLNHFESFACYVGVSGAFLSLYGFFFVWNRKTLFWKAIAVLILLVILDTPVTYLHYVLTGRKSLLFGRLAWILPLCAAVLAAHAGMKITGDRRQGKRFAIFSGVLFLFVMTCIFVTFRDLPEEARQVNGWIMQYSVLGFVGLWIAMLGTAVFVQRRGFSPITGKVLIAGLVIADLIVFGLIDGSNSNPLFTPEPFFRANREEQAVAAEFLDRGRNFRILGMSAGTQDDRNIALGVYNSSGYDNLLPARVSTLYNHPRTGDRMVDRGFKPYSLRKAQLTSTKYFVWENEIREIPDALPRAGLYSRYLVEEDQRTTLDTLIPPVTGVGHRQIYIEEGVEPGGPAFPPLRIVILDQPPRMDIKPRADIGTARIVQEGHNEIEIDVFARANALLLLTDTYYDGWSVFVDGTPGLIHRANYAFRAVEVPAGRHAVSFRFQHPGFIAGKYISLAALGVLLALIVLQGLRSKRSIFGV